ncbi:hypothetical protein BM221_008654 [Beauveria bassiana]|uniref:Uncharacterized protein n=1 Tax=Beauveria bassiana TaxID=176275 RepID=A0A2N6NDG3_BEABA|nr:hypothetical protein BM221_008654 [Beauveria bassiana]
MGVRPSFEGRGPVVENCRATVAAAVDCHAGTRKPGSEVTGENATRIAGPSAAFFAGVNIAVIELSAVANSVLPLLWSCKGSAVTSSASTFLAAYSSRHV